MKRTFCDVTLDHRLPLRHRAFDLDPAGVADVVHRLADGREVDAALTEQEAVLLRVELADAIATELADLGGMS